MKERNLFLSFTFVLLLALSLIMLLHGRLHNDRKFWYTQKGVRISFRLFTSIAMFVHISVKEYDNVYALLHSCAAITMDFVYNFYAKRVLAEEHDKEELEYRSSHGSEDVDVEVPRLRED